jgi:hypothetical protein
MWTAESNPTAHRVAGMTLRRVRAAVVAPLALVAGCFSSAGGSDGGEEDAYEQCVERVSDELLTPATADFSGFGDAEIERDAAGMGWYHYRVKGYVDSENEFGAIVRSDFSCQVDFRYNGWTVPEVDVQPRG